MTFSFITTSNDKYWCFFLNLGADVIITDRPVALDNLKNNVQLNSGNITGSAVVDELIWGRNLELFKEPFDFVIGADIIYIEDTFDDLLSTIRHLSDRHTTVILSCRIRYQRDRRFLDMLRQFFKVQEVLYDSKRDVIIYSAVRNDWSRSHLHYEFHMLAKGHRKMYEQRHFTYELWHFPFNQESSFIQNMIDFEGITMTSQQRFQKLWCLKEVACNQKDILYEVSNMTLYCNVLGFCKFDSMPLYEIMIYKALKFSLFFGDSWSFIWKMLNYYVYFYSSKLIVICSVLF